MKTETAKNQLLEIAERISDMREIMGFSESEMAEKTEVSLALYKAYESGEVDLPFTFIHKCALAFGIDITDLLEGHSSTLTSYTVTRKGMGQQTAKETGIDIMNMAPKFKNKLAEPYWVRYEYSDELQHQPIHLTKHSGQEFDLVLSGALLVQVGSNKEILHEGDSIYYNSSTPHGMIAVEGKDCVFCAVVMNGEDSEEYSMKTSIAPIPSASRHLLCEKFVECTETENGVLKDVKFKNTESFNFGFDCVDAIAEKYPEKLAMIHLDKNKTERRFTFLDMKKESARCANYFLSLGIRKGDKVMLVLKRHYQFWFAMLALHKIGAIAIPATYQLREHDFVYRFNAAGVKAIVCTSDGDCAEIVDKVQPECPTLTLKVLVGGQREGWKDFDSEYGLFKSSFRRTPDTPSGDDPALMFFSSGTTGNPKMVEHKHTYGLGHFLTARYWHCCEPDGLHFTISDTGWGKSLWGKLYGQWLCEGAVFVYDFERFHASDLLPLFAKYQITTFCAPPTMLRMMIKEDLSRYDFSSVRHMTTAGEALNPEVAMQFKKSTGLEIMEGFGQTETTLTVGNFGGTKVKLGSMGKPSPQYKVMIVDPDGNEVPTGETGEIVIDISKGSPVGLFTEYYRDEEKTREVMHDGFYHTGDTAWRDEDGYFFYVGRVDDIIKSSGYRIGPFEVESVIMELPYVLECGVSACPDPVRGQVVKASIVLTKGTEPTEELKKEIQDYVKAHTAPYKYPRVVVFRDELPKTISGKIRRNAL
ncbi:MAG: AMP-binding protein [Candidatus Ornithospirochaeta sp.]|nr:AMP-binding protein [Sphaerochaetaceae bacterium]MDY5523218.1 AMP-binding protein [Candidatus Ornithospirochaeta sp.]